MSDFDWYAQRMVNASGNVPAGTILDVLDTVAIAKAEQRYLDPVRNVVPLTGQDIEILKADLGYTRCAVCRIWFGPLEEQCPRCEIPRHRRDGW